jgi:hypothetical protein
MPNYTIRWTNRSNSDQDWQIHNGDHFQLQPNFVRSVAIVINNNYAYQIAVSTNGGFAAANLSYTAATDTWALNSNTPNEWQLAVGGGNVTVRCLLEDVAQAPAYAPSEPVLDAKEKA